jgi:hypothetical protein
VRELPIETAAPATKSAAWRPRYGVAAILGLLAVASAAACAWLYLTEPKPPDFDTGRSQQILVDQLDELTPANAWRWWIDNQQQLEEGFVVYPFHLSPVDEQKLTLQRFAQKALLAVTAVFAASAVASFFWPTSSRAT